MKILCRAYNYFSATGGDRDKVNYFSGLSPAQVGPTLDLTAFVKEGSNEWIHFFFEQVRNTGSSLEYSFRPSEFDLELSGIVEQQGMTLYNFFSLRSNLTFVRFVVDLEIGGMVIWQGIIYPDQLLDINPEDTDAVESESLTFQVKVTGLEREFVEWFDEQPIISPSEIAWTGTLPFAEGKRYITLTALFQQFFPSVEVQIQPMTEWVISELPDFRISGAANNIYWVPLGYSTLYSDRALSRWQFLSEIMTGMGWVFELSFQAGQLQLVIRDRKPSLIIAIVDGSTMLSNYEQKIIGPKVDNIIMFALGLFGGDDAFRGQPELRGDRFIAFSSHESRDRFVNLSHFNRLLPLANKWRVDPTDGYEHYKYSYDDQTRFIINRYIFSAFGVGLYLAPSSYPYLKHHTLFLNSGSNNVYKFRVDLNASLAQTEFVENTNTHIGDGDLIYWGSTCNMMLKLNGSSVPSTYYSVYPNLSYISTSQFSNNMKSLITSNDVNHLTIELAALITNPNVAIRLINTGDPSLENVVYNNHELAYNPFREHTQLTLTRTFNQQQ